MSGKCFVDTEILIYAHDRCAGVKHLRALMLLEHLWDSGWGVLSTQVLEELSTHLSRNAGNPVPAEEIRSLIRDYSTWEVVANTPESIVDSLGIVMRDKIPFWDAQILEAAERAGVSIIYSEALATAQRYGSIRVINPLLDPIPAEAESQQV